MKHVTTAYADFGLLDIYFFEPLHYLLSIFLNVGVFLGPKILSGVGKRIFNLVSITTKFPLVVGI